MGNFKVLPNINLDSIVLEDEKEEKNLEKKSTFDVKNYLNVRLGKDEQEKTLTIRILPMDLETGNPFAKIFVHNVKVPKEMVKPDESGYKSFICLSKNADIDHEKYGTKCPFCEMNKAAYYESTKETDPVKKKELQKLSIDNKAIPAVVVRCIERGHEDEGVKFWKFNIREKDKQDPYNQIVSLANMRKESAAKKGRVENILDIYEGKDLNVTISSSEGTSAPKIIDDERCPLSENEEQMKKWIYDEKKWQDVFTCKDYDYLNLVSQMKIPWFDKTTGKWIDKEEYEAKRNENTNNLDKKINEARKNVKLIGASENNNIINELTLTDDDLPN